MNLNIEVTCSECSGKLTTILEPAQGVFNLKLKVVECEYCKEAGEQAAVTDDYEKRQKTEKEIKVDVVINQTDRQNISVRVGEE